MSAPAPAPGGHPWLLLLQRLAGDPADGCDAVLARLDEEAAEATEGDRLAVLLPDGVGGLAAPEAHARRLQARFGVGAGEAEAAAECRAAGRPLVGAGGLAAAPLPAAGGALVASRTGGAVAPTDLPLLAALAGLLDAALGRQAPVEPPAPAAAFRRPPPDPRLRVIGDAPGLRAALAVLDAANQGERPLLLRGPTGSGKTLLARLAHARSPRAALPCHVLPCAGQEDDALAARLLGRWLAPERFAPGLIELACGGTLVLDDFEGAGDALQAALVRALDGELQRPRTHQAVRVDIRLVVTTGRDLSATLRPGLWTRIGGAVAELPPLAERLEDLDALVDHVLGEWSVRFGVPRRTLTARARAALLARPWAGNVRELRATVELAAAQAEGALITEADLPSPPCAAAGPAAATPLVTLAELEAQHIQRVLAHCQGNKSQAADLLGIGRNTLYAKLRELRLG